MSVSLQEMDRSANKAAQKYMGDVAWGTVAYGSVLVVGYVWMLAATLMGAFPLWAAFLIIMLGHHHIYSIAHDATHYSISGKDKSKQWLNDLLGLLAGQILAVPFTAHRKEHLAHHRNTNKVGEDPDLAVAGSFWRLWVGALKAIPIQYSFYFKNHWGHAPRSEKVILMAELAVMLGWRIGLAAMGYWQEALVLFVFGSMAGVWFLMMIFAWIVHHPHEAVGRYVDTATFTFPKWIDGVITLAWGYQNYHSVHHLFPRVPFYRYRQLYREIEPVMEAHGAPIYRFGARPARAEVTV